MPIGLDDRTYRTSDATFEEIPLVMDELLQEMIDPEPPRRDAARRRRLWTTIAVLGLAGVGITSLTTSALFTDTQTVAGDLVTGTVSVTLDPNSTAKLVLNAGNIAPGDTVNAPVVVKNAGSLQLRYAISYDAAKNNPAGSTAAGDLRDKLALSILPLGTNASCAAVPQAAALGSTTAITAAAFTPIVGDPTVGYQAGDRTLDTTGTETLCVRLVFDKTADNTYQSTGATLNLQFDAEQTVNN